MNDRKSRFTAILTLALLCACDDAPKSSPGSAPAMDPKAGHSAPRSAEAPAAGLTYDLLLTTDPSAPAANVKTRLVFDPRRSDNTRLAELAIVHEKPLHLILVSQDLSFFGHEHPERQTDGTYALDYRFPAPGEYLLFGDFAPQGAAPQVARMPVNVTGAAPAAKPLNPDDRGSAKRFGDLTVALAPAALQAGADTILVFTIEQAGKPVTGLRPYLGAMGHCVILDATVTNYLHSHPLENGDPSAAPGVVQFHTVFPNAGTYKVWGQFDVAGTMLVADFVVTVGDGSAAAPTDPHAGHHH